MKRIILTIIILLALGIVALMLVSPQDTTPGDTARSIGQWIGQTAANLKN